MTVNNGFPETVNNGFRNACFLCVLKLILYQFRLMFLSMFILFEHLLQLFIFYESGVKIMANLVNVFETMRQNKGFSGACLKKEEMPEKWAEKVNAIRMTSFDYAVKCKNAENGVKVSADDVYNAFNDFIRFYGLPIKANRDTAVYLSGRAMSTKNAYSDHMTALYAKKREAVKSDNVAMIAVYDAKIASAKKTAYAVFKADTLVSERVFRKTFEDYLVTLMDGLTDQTAEQIEARRKARREAKKAKKAKN